MPANEMGMQKAMAIKHTNRQKEVVLAISVPLAQMHGQYHRYSYPVSAHVQLSKPESVLRLGLAPKRNRTMFCNRFIISVFHNVGPNVVNS